MGRFFICVCRDFGSSLFSPVDICSPTRNNELISPCRVVKCLTNDSWSHSHSISPPYLDVVTNSHFYAVITDNLCGLLIFWQFHGLLACHRRHLMPHVCGVYNFSVTQNRMQLSSNLFVQLNCMCLTHI